MGDFKSVDLLNAIRNGASEAYKERIPTATQANIAQVGSAILSFTADRNEFVNALLNRIGLVVVKNKLYENPLKEFKKGMLEWGKSIEEVYVDLIEAQAFDPKLAETELFKRNLPDVKAIFHQVNRQDMYPTTVSNEQIKMAFLSDEGFSNLIDKIVQSLYTSDNLDEFLLMKGLIHQYGVEGKFKMIAVTPVTDEATAKLALKTIKSTSNKLTFMSKDYNFAGVNTVTPKEDQIILIDTDFDAMVDVEVLAAAFNMDKADFIGRRVLVDNFGGLTNVLCALVDRDWFMVYDKLITSEEVYNPKGLYYNYFLHHWQVMSTSQFANAVLFVTVAPTVATVVLTPATATVAKGQSLQFNVEVTGTGNPPSKCTFEVDGTDSYISSTGLLIVGENESVVGGDLTVTATNVFDGSKSDTATITVV